MTGQWHSFPAWAYGPNGEEAIFEKLEDIPEGWLDYPLRNEELLPDHRRSLAPKMNGNALADLVAPTLQPASGDIVVEPKGEPPVVRKLGRGISAPPVVTQELYNSQQPEIDAARQDAISIIREAGGAVPDDATDEQLHAALDALEGT